MRAAYSILAVADEHMVTAIRDITVNEGLDPRESLVVAGGGAGGLTIARIAEELGCARVLVPRTAAALSACGGLLSDVVAEFSVSRRADTDRFEAAAVNDGLAELERQMDEFLDRLQAPADARGKEFFVEARYPYQVWELEVPLPNSRFEGEEDVRALEEAFHVVHERVFAVKEPGQRLECLYWKGRCHRAPAQAEQRRGWPSTARRRRSRRERGRPRSGPAARRKCLRISVRCSRRASESAGRRSWRSRPRPSSSTLAGR